jgi:hypothetical protein
MIAVSVTMFPHPQATIEIMKAIIQDRPLLFIFGLIGLQPYRSAPYSKYSRINRLDGVASTG